jgi:hypothetical protein
LKKYADYSWNIDPNHYVIFEHLGGNNEEQQWANYRLNESPSNGVMMWGIMTYEYNNLTKGYAGNISRMSSSSRGFNSHRLMGYAESHDEERLMYNNLQSGNNSTADHNVRTLNVALSRMSALGAVSLLVPGPKMIWQFGELGWDSSIFTCNNGTVNSPSDGTSGDCKLDTKPQPQWTGNWLGDANRSKIYNEWAKMITMKTVEPVFSGTVTINNSSSLLPNIKITNSELASSELKDVLIVANFNVIAQNVASGFPYTGTWYNLMDNTAINVISTSAAINLQPGEFKIYGNKTASLAIADYEKSPSIVLYPNPVSNYFTLNETTTKVQVFSITGQLMKSFNAGQTESYQYIVSDLSNGMYVVKAYNDNDELQLLKFIKK